MQASDQEWKRGVTAWMKFGHRQRPKDKLQGRKVSYSVTKRRIRKKQMNV